MLSVASLFLLNSPFNRAEHGVNSCSFSPETEKSAVCCLLAVCVCVTEQMFQIIAMECIMVKLSQSL